MADCVVFTSLCPHPGYQTGRRQLRGALASQGCSDAPQHQTMAQCIPPLQFHGEKQQHATPTTAYKVLHHCVQVRLLCFLCYDLICIFLKYIMS